MTTPQSGAPETTPGPHGAAEAPQEPFQVVRLRRLQSFEEGRADGVWTAKTMAEFPDMDSDENEAAIRENLIEAIERTQVLLAWQRGRLTGFREERMRIRNAVTSTDED